MKTPEDIFDICYASYRAACCGCGELPALQPIKAKTGARRSSKPGKADYIVDFANAGRAALKGAEMHSLLVLFEVYHLGQAPWSAAWRHVGVNEITAADWLNEIRAIVGNELKARGLYPPGEYFG